MTEKDLRAMWHDEVAAIEAEGDGDEDLELVVARPKRKRAQEASQVYSVRIPVRHLESLRRLAEERGQRPASLVREWVLERLHDEVGRSKRSAWARHVATTRHVGHGPLMHVGAWRDLVGHDLSYLGHQAVVVVQHKTAVGDMNVHVSDVDMVTL